MPDPRILKTPAIVIAVAMTASWLQTSAADATQNPFRAVNADSGFAVLAQGQCGEGKCGGKMMRKGGKCGMQRMDADGDGKVTRDEFMQGHEDMFSRIDKNADGVIDGSERDAHRQMMRHHKGKGPCRQSGSE